jgi:hypothetical protein
MRNSQTICAALMMVVFLPLVLAQTEPPQQTVLPIGSAVVSEIKGEVVFTSPQGAFITAQRGSTLAADSRIETAKGSLLLELQDGSQVLVKGHSTVVLRAPNQGKGYSLELFIGKILVKVQRRLGGTPSFRMGTPSAVITVRGTRFWVEVNKKRKTFVDVFEGVVEVAGFTAGSPPVLIRPGFSTGVEIERAPEEPREINPRAGPGREGGREGQAPGRDRSPEDQPRNQPQPRNPNPGAEGKPD